MDLTATADYLASLRLEQTCVEELPVDLMPIDVSRAYQVQEQLVDRLCAAWAGHRAGYKVALTNEAAQRMLGVPHPVFGSLISSRIYNSGATLEASDYVVRIIEVEFGFRIGADVPSTCSPYDHESISRFVDEAYPAIEVVEHHFAGIDRVTPESLCADNAIHGAWVRGEAIANWCDLDLAAQQTRLLVNGEEKFTGAGDRVLGHPLAPIAWLVTELAGHGRTLKAGDFVTTGVTTDAVYPAQAGDCLVGDFPGVGKVELNFS